MELNTTTRSTTLIITSMLVCSPSLKVLMTPSTSECPRVDTFEAEHVEVALFVLKFEERIIRPKFPHIHCYVTIGRITRLSCRVILSAPSSFKASTNVGESVSHDMFLWEVCLVSWNAVWTAWKNARVYFPLSKEQVLGSYYFPLCSGTKTIVQ